MQRRRTISAKTILLLGSIGLALAVAALLVPRPAVEKQSANRSASGSPLIAFALASGGPPPKADAGFDQSVVVGETAVLDASGSSDPEGDELSFAWSFDSLPTGSLALISDPAAIKPSFQADEPGDYVARLTATDQFGKVASDTVTVSTGNVAPVADAGPDQTVDVAGLVRLDASGSSDVNGDGLSFTWTITGKPTGSTAALDDAAALRPSFTADKPGEYMLSLTASDGALSSAADQVRISTFDSHPVAEAGPDQKVAVGQTVLVRLEGLFDVDGELIEERDWSIIARPPGSSADFLPNKNRRFVIDAPGTYVVQRMTIEETGGDDDDDDGDAFNGGSFSGFDTVILTTDGNIRPVANAGADQSVLPGDLVALRGAGSSDLDGDELAYRWALTTVPAGSTAVLDDPNAVNPGFEADLAGSYVAQLIVKDGAEQSRPDTVVITTGNSRPVANAGPDQQKPKKNTITLDGGASSDADNDSLTYDWSLTKRPSASNATLNNPTNVNPTFYTDTGRRFVAQLIVRDGELASAPENVVVGPGNMRPVAEAGPDQEVLPGQLVQLDGTGTFDAANDPLVFQWALLSAPEGSTAALTGAGTATPSFTADLPGVYVAQLVVTDDDVAPLVSDPDTVVIAINNTPPVADAGPDQRVAIPRDRLVQLAGGGSSDPDGDPISFAWSFASTPTGSTAALSDPGAENPTFVADLAGDYVVQLVVNDGIADSDPDLVTVTADANRPIADAGPDQSVTAGALVTLDGSASSDPEGGPLTYSWQFLFTPHEDPPGPPALSDATAVGPTFTADLAGLYIAELTVSDGAFDSQADTVAVRAGSAVGNNPPTLDPIGNLSVALGSTLQVTLGGSDPGGDAIFFRAAPQPLPDGASLDAASGLFTFTPSPEQVGDIALTFTVSDGLATMSESVTITVTPPAPGTLTAFSARVLDADAFHLDMTELGVAGATVTLGGVSATTATDGSFTLSGAPAGAGLLVIDSSTATPFPDPAPNGSGYAGLNETITLIADAVNQRDAPFFLMRVDPATLVPVNPATTTVVTNPALPGVSLSVPAGSTSATELSVSELPAGVRPASIPASILPCQVVKLLPFGATFSPAASLTLPNLDNLPAGTEVDLWGLDPATGGFRVLGQGAVGAGGITATSLITEATYLFAVPRAPGATAAADENAFNKTPTVLADGNFSTSVTLPSYRSLGQDRAQTFVYNSTAADPRPIIATEVTFPAATGLPPLIEGRLEVAGIEVAGPVFMDTTVSDPRNGPGDPPLVAGDTVRQAISFDASQFATGSYPYRYTATGNFGCSKVSATSTGSVIIDNQEDSPIGAGWSLAGQQRATQLPDGRVAIREGDGTVLVFDPVVENDLPIVFPDFGDLSQFRLNGSVVAINRTPVVFGGQTVLRLTNNFSQASTAVLNEPVPLEADGLRLSFRSFFTFQMTDSRGARDFDGPGADGIVFAILNRPDIVGGTGRGIGYGGIRPSVAVELDTFGPQLGNTFDPNGNHVGINLNGNLRSLAATIIPTRMNNGAVWYVWVEYNGESRTLEARVSQTPERPADPTVSQVVDLVDVLGGTTAFLGFTSATGAATNDNDLRSWDVRIFGGDIETIAFVTPRGDFSTLVKNPTTGGLTRTLKDGRSFVFDASGRQTAEIDRNGNRTDYLYDAQGRVTSITDPVGQTTTFEYGPDGKLASVTDPAGRVTSYVYDPLGTLLKVVNPDGSEIRYDYTIDARLTAEVSERGFVTQHNYGLAGQWTGSTFPDGASVALSVGKSLGLSDLGSETNPRAYVRPQDRVSDLTDANGNRYQMELNRFGALVRLTDPIGRVKRFERDANNLVVRIVTATDYHPSGQVISELEWDPVGNLVSQTEAEGTALAQTTRYAYEPKYNRLIKLVDASNNDPTPACGTRGVTCYEYDAFGNQTRIVGPDGAIESFTYNAQGLRLSSTDARGNTTGQSYDIVGNLSSTINAAGIETALRYDGAGNNTEIVEANGTPEARTTSFTYDSRGRLVSETDPAGTVARYTYDAAGNRTVENNDVVRETLITYDSKGRVATVSEPDRGTTLFGYDKNGNTTEITDPLGGTTRYVYDATNRRVRAEDPELGIRHFSYDAQDNLIQVVGARGFAITFAYDLLGRMVGQTDALGGMWSRSFDVVGNLLMETDAKGQTKEHEYDQSDRLIGTTARYTDGTLADRHAFSYDAAGNLLTAIDNDSSLAWTYDELNRVATSSTTGEPFTVQPGVSLAHSYDAFNNSRAVEAAMGPSPLGTTLYDYTPDDLLARVTAPGGETVHFAYDGLDRTTSLSWGSSASTALSFGPSNPRPDGILHRYGERELARFAYGYDLEGKVISVDGPRGSRSLTYDHEQRLTGATRAAEIQSYAYDADGNRTSSHLSSAYSLDDANQLIEDDGHCYDYDANGNLIGKTTKIGTACTGATTIYGWDAFDRLTRIEFPNGTFAAYRYDVLGRRIEKDAPGGVIRYVYDQDNVVLEFDASNSLTARYTHGLDDDEPLVMERSGVTYSYQADELGSIRLVTDSAGNVVNRYDYDSFGNLDGSSFASVANPYAFTGREWDAESGLYHYRFRYYDPSLGRFLSRDPIGLLDGDFTLYAYVHNNPHNFRDPQGLAASADNAVASCAASAYGSATGSFFGALAGTLLAAVNRAITRTEAQSSAEILQEAVVAASWAAGIDLAITFATGGCGRGSGFWPRARNACSFDGETLVRTEKGFEAIKDLEAQVDWVWSRDEETGDMALKPIIAQHLKYYEETVHVQIRDLNSGAVQTIVSNRVHPFYVSGHDLQSTLVAVGGIGPIVGTNDTGRWVQAQNLKAGDRLLNSVKGWSEVVDVSVERKPLTAFNLTVADYHTYFVRAPLANDNDAVWVRNCGRKLWHVTREGASRALRHGKFGTIYKSKTTGLWWAKDTARHGGSEWKVFRETPGGLQWYRDADKFGDFITGKHKGPTGRFIPWSRLRSVF